MFESKRAAPDRSKLHSALDSDGSFRILVGSPSWHGGDAAATASTLLQSAKALSSREHRAWWQQFWERAGLMKLSSSDHSAEYLENLRIIDLYTAAAESRDRLPGSQAGIGDLFLRSATNTNGAPLPTGIGTCACRWPPTLALASSN